MSIINPFLDASKYYGDLRKILFGFDVDLALQPSMDRTTTLAQRESMWELFQMTDGGVVVFTGRTHQSAFETFGHDYAGVYEHYSVGRFGHGNDVTFMAPRIDTNKMGKLCYDAIGNNPYIRIVEQPTDIRDSNKRAVHVEVKNTSVALVHTTLVGDNFTPDQKLEYLTQTRNILKPAAELVLAQMGLSETHWVKPGNDAVELLPRNMDVNNDAHKYLQPEQITNLQKYGLSKATATHNFMSMHTGRSFVMTGDSEPDLLAMVEGKKHFNGKGVYVSNGLKLSEKFTSAVDYQIDNHVMTWPLIADTVANLRDAAPKHKMPLPPIGGMTPDLSNLN